MSLPQPLYAQVVKTVRCWRLVRVRHRVVFGTVETVNTVLAPRCRQINTAFIERLNLPMHQHMAAVGRRVTTLYKGEDGLRQQLALDHAYYIFASRMRAYASPCHRRSRRLAWARPSSGGPARQQWRRDRPIGSGHFERS
jgi:hypothetical protein